MRAATSTRSTSRSTQNRRSMAPHTRSTARLAVALRIHSENCRLAMEVQRARQRSRKVRGVAAQVQAIPTNLMIGRHG
eukprot:scaffold200206_cov23-Tisochrysis_lutea.AAC.1